MALSDHLVVWAATTSDALDPLDWLQYGVLGLVVVSFLFGWLWPRPSVEQLKRTIEQTRADREAVEAQRDLLIKCYEDKVIPALLDVQRTVLPASERMARVLDAMVEGQNHMESDLSKLGRELADVLAVLRARDR